MRNLRLISLKEIKNSAINLSKRVSNINTKKGVGYIKPEVDTVQ